MCGVCVCVCRFWVMPFILLKNVIMGNLHRPTTDAAISDSIDFISDTVIIMRLLLLSVVIVYIYIYV